jgi:hypothetical protein
MKMAIAKVLKFVLNAGLHFDSNNPIHQPFHCFPCTHPPNPLSAPQRGGFKLLYIKSLPPLYEVERGNKRG